MYRLKESYKDSKSPRKNEASPTIDSMLNEVQFKGPKVKDITLRKYGLHSLNRHMDTGSLRRRVNQMPSQEGTIYETDFDYSQ